MKVDKITSPVWADRGHTTINCIVKFSDAETECVFTASADDPESYGREIFEACIRGDAGPVGEYRANDDMAVEEARRMKNAEINAWRDAMEASGYVFEHRGRKWDYGKETMTRLGMSASAARGGVLPEGFFWTDAENNDGKRLVRTVLIFTESSDQLSRATDRVPGLPASPGYVQ